MFKKISAFPGKTAERSARNREKEGVKENVKINIRKIAVCAAAVGITLALPGVADAGADTDTGTGIGTGVGTGTDTAGTAVFPFGITETENGGLLITDRYHKAVWLESGNEIIRYAGAPGSEGLYGEPAGGYADGRLSAMRMRDPWAIIPYRDGYAVSDRENHVVRYLTSEGAKTLAGTGTEGYLNQMANHALFSMPTGLATDPEGNLYIADTGNDVIRMMTAHGQVNTFAEGFSGPTGLSYYDGALYVSDTGNHRIMKVQDGKITVVAGKGTAGYSDGSFSEAEFSAPGQLVFASDGTLYVSDTGNGEVRKVSGVAADGNVTTLLEQGSNPDGSMVSPAGLLVKEDKLYVCDSFLRKIVVLDR